MESPLSIREHRRESRRKTPTRRHSEIVIIITIPIFCFVPSTRPVSRSAPNRLRFIASPSYRQSIAPSETWLCLFQRFLRTRTPPRSFFPPHPTTNARPAAISSSSRVMSESRSTQTARPRQVAFTTPSFPDAGIDADDEDSHSDFSGSPAASRSSTGLASGSSATTRTRIPPSSRTVGLSPSRNGRGSVASQSDGPEGASQSGRSASLVESTALVLWHVWHGLTDAFAWPASLITIYGSKTIQVASFKCLFLNFGVFIGSWLLYRYAVSPLFHLVVSPVPIGDSVPLGKLSETDTATAAADGVANWFRSLLRHLRPSYYILWDFPVYAASFLLNTFWYQQIADRAYTIVYGKPVANPQTYDWFLKRVADDSYRYLLLLNYIIITALAASLPYVGLGVSFMLCNWLVAFFCFEYKWASRGWTLERRIEHFESRWAYFAGFGLPCTALAFAFPIFLSAGFFAMLFPVYIIMANRASPSPKPSEAVRYTLWPERMAIFSIPSRVNNAILSALCGPRRARRQ